MKPFGELKTLYYREHVLVILMYLSLTKKPYRVCANRYIEVATCTPKGTYFYSNEVLLTTSSPGPSACYQAELNSYMIGWAKIVKTLFLIGSRKQKCISCGGRPEPNLTAKCILQRIPRKKLKIVFEDIFPALISHGLTSNLARLSVNNCSFVSPK